MKAVDIRRSGVQEPRLHKGKSTILYKSAQVTFLPRQPSFSGGLTHMQPKCPVAQRGALLGDFCPYLLCLHLLSVCPF